MASRLANMRERIHREIPFVLVENGNSQVWKQHNHESLRWWPESWGIYGATIRGVRADIFIDDNPEGQSRAFKNLLAGLSITTITNGRIIATHTLRKGSPATFFHVTIPRVRATTLVNPSAYDEERQLEVGVIPPEDGEHMGLRHATTETWSRDVQVLHREEFGVRVEYKSDIAVPLGFFRLVFFGIATRDVQ